MKRKFKEEKMLEFCLRDCVIVLVFILLLILIYVMNKAI